MIEDISNINSDYKYCKSYNHTLKAKRTIMKIQNFNVLRGMHEKESK